MYYRKYRPQTIGELDNTQIRETLGVALLANNWVHAYLLTGPRGSGKTSTARLIAKIVNCTNRKKGEEPCNKCESCKAITSGSSLDVVEIDAASNTGVDDIRDLREKAKLATSGSRYKVYIIDEVHMLSTGAFNALLKILEEPPEHVMFVLATTDPQKLPETIMSRCLIYDFGKITHAEIVQSLAKVVKGEKLTVAKDVLDKVAEAANGSYRDGQKILEQMVMGSAKIDLEHMDGSNSQSLSAISERLLNELLDHKASTVVEEVEKAIVANLKIKDLIGSLITRLRDILLFRSGVIENIKDVVITNEEINWLINQLIEANGLTRDCPVPQLPLEMVLMEFCRHPEPVTELGKITKIAEPSDLTTIKPVDKPKTDDPVESTDKTNEKSGSSDMADFWNKVLVAIKPYNHSLEALLKASRAKSVDDEYLKIEVFYKFHKERLEEPKNREILEKVVSDIIGADTKVKYVLAEKKS